MTSLPERGLLAGLVLILGSGGPGGCSAATRLHDDADVDIDTRADADADIDADTGADADANDDAEVSDADPDEICPPAVGFDTGQVTTPVISTDPDSFVGQEIVVVGTLVTSRSYFCNDLGPCGTCFPGLTLDGVIRLWGSGPGGQLCDEEVGCVERFDSCLPHWQCWPFEIGRRVRVRGTFRRDHDTDPAQNEWERLQQGWFLEVEAIESIAPVAGVGLFEGTLFVGAIDGPDCPAFPNSLPIELVVAYGSPGFVAEPMSPSEVDIGSAPVFSGWHIGPASDTDIIELETAMGLGLLVLTASSLGYSGSYDFSLSGPACRVESTLEVEQVY